MRGLAGPQQLIGGDDVPCRRIGVGRRRVYLVDVAPFSESVPPIRLASRGAARAPSARRKWTHFGFRSSGCSRVFQPGGRPRAVIALRKATRGAGSSGTDSSRLARTTIQPEKDGTTEPDEIELSASCTNPFVRACSRSRITFAGRAHVAIGHPRTFRDRREAT
jgi:hypothetical protein